MTGKLLGRLAFRGWRDGTRADRRWARNRESKQWQREVEADLEHVEGPAGITGCPRCLWIATKP